MSRFLKKLKGVTAIAIMLTVFLGIATPAFARVAQETITINYNNIRIAINGQLINTEFAPFVFQGRTYLPVRDVASAMGFHVTWEDATNTVHLTTQANVPQQTVNAPGRIAQENIVVNFNNIRFAINGTLVSTEYDPFIFQGRTYLPVRDVANATGFEVTWEDATNTVHLTSRAAVAPNYPPHQPVVPNYPAHQPPAQVGNITIPANIVPRSPARTGGPANPTITAQRAVELARDHLVSIGVTSARFDYVYMDLERGTWVWSVEFDGQGRSFEFYVNVETGAFLQAPQGSGTAGTTTPPPTQTTPPQQTAPPPSGTQTQGNRPSNPAISRERAIEIGYAEIARRGHTGTFRRDSGMDWEPRYGGWVWEVLFRVQGGRLPLVEMYICVHTGNVAKFEWDD
jgi:hypothetical protein